MDVFEPPSFDDIFNDEIRRYLSKQFSRTKDDCYLDHAGATLYSEEQIKEVAENLLTTIYANPHSAGVASSFTYDSIESVRYRILEHFNTTSDEYSVIFTSGATAALKTVAETFNFKAKNGNFVYTQDNHTSVLGMRELVSKNYAKVTCLSNNELATIFTDPLTSMTISGVHESNSLFVYSAQCNFSGHKFPLRWIPDVHNGALQHVFDNRSTKWYVLLDAAAYCATNNLDLSTFKPDFVCLSFYKMFGYPTGIGALLIRNKSAEVLKKEYYGGGTVDISFSSTMFHVKRSNLQDRFEDGTIPFISIISLMPGFKMLNKLTMSQISEHVFVLAKYLHHSLMLLHHHNRKPVVKLYADTNYENKELQGGIVTFNILRSNGEYVGYMEVLNMASLYKIHLRTGCFCNPGACQRHLNLSNTDLAKNYDAGYVCGGPRDLIDGKPTGAVRISFGYMSTLSHAQKVLKMIKDCFLDGPEVLMHPIWWKDAEQNLNEKYVVKYKRKQNNCLANKSFNTNANLKNKLNELYLHGEKVKEDFILQNKIKNIILCEKNNYAQLKRLFIYPIKSCGAFEILNYWKVGQTGLKYDREWMIATDSGVCLTQKQEVNLCLIKPKICLEKKELVLSYPGMPDISVPLANESLHKEQNNICRSKICGHKVEGTDCGINVSEWLSSALKRPKLRLIRQSKSYNEIRDPNKPELSFVSQAQYLLINESSVSWLTEKISESEDFCKRTMMHRFRGNIIISGCEPFNENSWNQIVIGKNEFEICGPCTRCQMICIDQTTGKKTIEPLRTLASELNGKIRFGVYLSKKCNSESILSIGDLIYTS